MDIEQALASLSEDQLRQRLGALLRAYTTPVFGALPKAELEMAMLDALIQVGLIAPEPSIYELVAGLRVTRAKARNLLYARELRRSSAAELDRRLKDLLAAPLILRQGEAFALEVENPLLADHLKARLQRLGHASDSSFSPSLVTLRLDAMAALLASCLSGPDQAQLREAILRKAGAPDSSLQALLAGALKKLGSKLADKAGEAAAEQASELLKPLLDAAIKPAAARIVALLGRREGA